MNAFNRKIAVGTAAELPPQTFQFPARQRWPIRFQAIETLAMLADGGAILVSCLLAALLNSVESLPMGGGKAVGVAIVVAALFICLLKAQGLYRPVELLALQNQARAVALAWGGVFVLLAAAVGALDMGHNILRGASMLAVFGLANLILLRIVIKRVLVKGLSGRKFSGRKVILITDQPKPSANGLEHMLATLGYEVIRRFMLPPGALGEGIASTSARR